MKKFVLLFLLLVLSVVSVSAAPPFVSEDSVGGLNIIHAELRVFDIDSQVELFFHVFNSTNNEINSSLVNCSIYVYNQSNGAILYDDVLTPSGVKFKHVLNMSVYTTGAYGYLVECGPYGVQREFGYVANGFYFSNTGEDILYDAFFVPAVLILIPLLFGWMLLYWCLSLGEDHTEVKIFMSLGSLMMVFFSLWWGMIAINKFFNWVEMQDAIGFTVWAVGIFFLIIWSYFMIYLLKKLFDTAKGNKIERLKY